MWPPGGAGGNGGGGEMPGQARSGVLPARYIDQILCGSYAVWSSVAAAFGSCHSSSQI